MALHGRAPIYTAFVLDHSNELLYFTFSLHFLSCLSLYSPLSVIGVLLFICYHVSLVMLFVKHFIITSTKVPAHYYEKSGLEAIMEPILFQCLYQSVKGHVEKYRLYLLSLMRKQKSPVTEDKSLPF